MFHKLLHSNLLVLAETAVPTDPTAYYDDYWKYASYYGEAAARIYYGAWSPPEGTPPPPGTVLPAASDDQANGASVVPSNGQASLTAGIDNAQQDKSGEKAKDDKNGSSEEVDAEV